MTREEWLKWRKKGLGGSDAPIVMGLSKYKTIMDLYDDKTSDNIDESVSFQAQKGIEMEPRIRSLFETLEMKSYPPALKELLNYPMIASLDGMSEDESEIIEIKLSGKEDYECAKLGKVPDKYWPQVQHNIFVTQAKKCFFICYPWSKEAEPVLDHHKLVVIEVKPDRGYLGKLILAETNFWNNHVVPRKPPPPSDRDFKVVAGIDDFVENYKRLLKEIKAYESEAENCREKIIEAVEASGHKRVMNCGLKIVHQERAGNVDYSKVPQLKGVDLEPFRKKGSSFWKLEIVS